MSAQKIIVTILFFIVLLYGVKTFLTIYLEDTPDELQLQLDKNKYIKLIALWTNYSKTSNWRNNKIRRGNYFRFQRCPEILCKIIPPDRIHLYRETEFDAILFNAINMRHNLQLPKHRSPHQLYVYVSLEVPHDFWLPKFNFQVDYNLTGK